MRDNLSPDPQAFPKPVPARPSSLGDSASSQGQRTRSRRPSTRGTFAPAVAAALGAFLTLGTGSVALGADATATVVPRRHQPPISTQGFDLSAVKLVDAAATHETVSLFAYLKNVARTHMLFGHQLTTALGFSVTRKDGSESDVLRAVGAFPAVYGWDALTITGQGETDYDIGKLMRVAYDRGGINTLSAHMHNFVTGGGFWDTSQAVVHILPGGSHHRAFTAYLDKVADFALRLRDAQGRPIPIIFRPFHENTGSWFWWGAAHCTPDEYKLLFRFTVEYLRDQRGVHSFLYAYSPATHFASEQDYLSRYPGDGYVDLLGVDGYDDDLTGNWMKLALRDLRIATRLAAKKGKVAVVAETGPTNQGLRREANPNKDWYAKRWLATLKRDPEARRVAYMLVWRNASTDHFWVPYRNHPTYGDHEMLGDFVRFCNDEWTVLNDQLSGVYALNVKALPSPPITYLAFPMNGQKVGGEYEIRVKADGRGTQVEKVVVSIAGAGDLPTSLRDGYYTVPWDFAQAPLGKPLAVTARATYAGGLVQTATATVKPSEESLRRITFSQGLDGWESDGTYAAAGTVRASIGHTDAFGGGALALEADVKDDRLPKNWTYQEMRAKLPGLDKQVHLARMNKVRYDLFIPVAHTGKFFLQPGLRFYLAGSKTADYATKGLFVTDLPVVTLKAAKYYRYAVALDVGDVRGAGAMALQVVTKDATYRGPVYLDDVQFLAAILDAPADPALVDTFEFYGGSASEVSERYVRNATGNSVRLTLDKQGKHAGDYGLRFHYGMGSPNYAGVTKVLANVDWRKYQQIEFWFKPDGKKQNLVIQIVADGKPFETWLPIKNLKEGRVTIPLSSLKRPRWAPDAGVALDPAVLKSVSAFSLFVNADPGNNPQPFESDLYFDDIRVRQGQ